MRRTKTEAHKKKPKARRGYKEGDYQKLAEEIIRPSHGKAKASHPIERKRSEDWEEREAEAAFWSLSREEREEVRSHSKFDSYESWYTSKHPLAKRERAIRKAVEITRGPKIHISTEKKRLSKELRNTTPAPPQEPFVALLAPAVIVPNMPDDKPVIADAGSIVRLMDQRVFYRSWISPVTQRSDELLVQYGNPKKLLLGWLSHKIAPKTMKPVRGPSFLVTTKDEKQLGAWDAMRLQVARYRKGEASRWIGSWLNDHGAQYPRAAMREVTQFFGGKAVKNEPFEKRALRLLQLITHTEIEAMPASKKTAKSSKKSSKSSKSVAPAKTKKTAKPAKAAKSKKGKSEFTASSRDFDEHVIRRLVKENPRKAGSEKAKIWAKLKKGMTVGEFVEKGGSRGAVRKYLDNQWVKLLAPASGKSSSAEA